MAGKHPRDVNTIKMEYCVQKGQEPGARHTTNSDKWEGLLRVRARAKGDRELVQINVLE